MHTSAYAHLKKKHKKKIEHWMFTETRWYYEKYYVFPDDRHLTEVIDRVYERIKRSGIDIPYQDILRQYRKNRSGIKKHVKKEMNLKTRRRTETVSFTNMCMIEDGSGNVVALDKVSGGYTGTTFPGGHVEDHETFHDAMIREVREETGLTIHSPLFCGVYHWYRNDTHHVILLYRARVSSGTLQSSEEGSVYWIPFEEYKKKELAGGMEQVLRIVSDEEARECFMYLKDGRYQERMF